MMITSSLVICFLLAVSVELVQGFAEIKHISRGKSSNWGDRKISNILNQQPDNKVDTVDIDNSNSNRVLVIGGGGRTGKQVVSRLLQSNYEVNLLLRNKEKFLQENAHLINGFDGARINCFTGDVHNVDDIIAASVGCKAVIAVHGPKPVRFSKFKDLFTHPSKYRKDESVAHRNEDRLSNNNLSPLEDYENHPYHVNYLGTMRIITAMCVNKVPKLVRLTGALVGQSAFSPFVTLFNVLLSKTVLHHERTERIIRDFKYEIDYTIVRAPGIIDAPALEQLQDQERKRTTDNKDTIITNTDKKMNINSSELVESSSSHQGSRNKKPRGLDILRTYIRLICSDDLLEHAKRNELSTTTTTKKKKNIRSQISTTDLAELIVRAVDDRRLSRTTVYIGYDNEEEMSTLSSPTTVASALDKYQMKEDRIDLPRRRHNLAIAFYMSILAMTSMIALRLAWMVTSLMIRLIARTFWFFSKSKIGMIFSR